MNKQPITIKKIAIIGFGAGGLSYFVQLVDACIKNNEKIIIYIFEKGPISKGLAYGGNCNSHILNLDIHTMCVTHTKPDHFFNWLIKERNNWVKDYPTVTIDDLYPPRPLFGKYLEDTFLKYLKIASDHKIMVKIHKKEIIDLICNKKNIEINLKDTNKKIYKVDSVLLSLGNFNSDKYTEFTARDGFYHSPWKIIKESNSTGPICILGTRLTAIDTVLSLIEKNKLTNKFYMVSRSGSLPKIIGPSKPYTLIFLTKDNIIKSTNNAGRISLDKLGQLFKQEIESAEDREVDWDKIINLNLTTLDSLEEEIKTVEKKIVRPWQSVLVAFYPLVPWTWSLLTEKDKIRFIKKYLGSWLTYLAAFPIQNAKKILDLIRNGSVEVRRDLTGVIYKNKKYSVSFKDTPPLIVNTVVNATGSGHRIDHSKLLTNMVKNKVLEPSKISGIDINPKNCRVILNTNFGKRPIFAIGEITFGSWLATADLGQISRQAELAINELLDEL